MAIPEAFARNFDTLLRAAADGALALLECRDAATGVDRYVICAVGWDADAYLLTPFGHLCDGNPYDAYLPPDSDPLPSGTPEGRRIPSK